jgi:hypothetical protein
VVGDMSHFILMPLKFNSQTRGLLKVYNKTPEDVKENVIAIRDFFYRTGHDSPTMDDYIICLGIVMEIEFIEQNEDGVDI